MLLYSPFIITLLITGGVVVFFGGIAFFYAFKISLNFNPKISSLAQFNLAKNAYLVGTIIVFLLTLKFVLFFFFIWSMDEVSRLVPGAMCGAGIVSATPFGAPLFFIKILALFLLFSWIFIHFEDAKTPNYKFTKLKFRLYLGLFLVLVVEYLLEILHFSNISTTKPVLCCSDIFKKENSVFSLNLALLVSAFYLLFIINLALAYLKKPVLLGIFSAIFLVVGILAIISFFSPYVYALPTHKCPFCMLQSDYLWVGYFIYTFIFFGTLAGVLALVSKALKVKISDKLYKISAIFNSLLVLLLSYYPFSYFIKNGVFLS